MEFQGNYPPPCFASFFGPKGRKFLQCVYTVNSVGPPQAPPKFWVFGDFRGPPYAGGGGGVGPGCLCRVSCFEGMLMQGKFQYFFLLSEMIFQQVSVGKMHWKAWKLLKKLKKIALRGK